MLKKINIIIIFSSLILSIKLNMGFTLFMPILIFYLLKDIKNIYFTYIPTIISTLLFMPENFISVLLILIITFIFYFLLTNIIGNRIKINIPIIAYIFLTNILYFIFTKDISYSKIIITTILSCLIYIYLERYLYKLLLEETISINDSLSSLSYLEILIAIIAVFSSTVINIYGVNLSIIYGSFFAMYFGKSYKNIYSFVFSITTMFILYIFFEITESIFLPFTSAFYIVSSSFISILYNLFIACIIFVNSTYLDSALISMMVVSIIFELFNQYLIKDAKKDDTAFEYIYNQIQKNTNEDIMNFSLFLDKFSLSFKSPKEYNERISNGIKLLVQNHCMKCPKKKECFELYKNKLYDAFKTLLLQEPNFNKKFPDFCNYCNQISSFENYSKFIESKIKAPLENELKKTNIMLAQLNGISSTIKKYVTDISSKEELSYYKIMLVKKRLEDYGYIITYFDVAKLFIDDFNIKIGIKGKKLEEVENTIKLIAKNILNQKVSVILDEQDRGNIYILIIPEIKIDITYGYGALSCDGEDICGDNYLIKEIRNGHFISAISDGMGKGYKAFYESDTTLKLVEDIVKLNLSVGTSLEILNSFYLIQEYLEEYATLDFLEINRYTEIANFYKMGGATSYIFKQDGTIEKIYNKSLPFGLDEEVSNISYKLSGGDLILMSSDGIFENIIDETSLQEYIESIKNLPPQKIVYELFNYTINNKIKTKDDMSLIALKIEKIA